MVDHIVTGYVRSRHLVGSSVGIALSLVATIAFFRSQLTLHFDPEGSQIRLGLLAPIIVVLFINVSLGDPVGEAERNYRSQMRLLRSVHITGILVLISLGLIAFAIIDGSAPATAQFGRNAALLTGLLLLATVLVNAQQAWLVPLAVALAMYGFGMNYSVGVPRSWAVLLQDPTPGNMLVGCAALVMGVALFIRWGPRTQYMNEWGA